MNKKAIIFTVAILILLVGAYETYFDPHGPGDDYWSFELQPGETQNFTIEFLIDRVYLSQKDPFLAITPGREIFYGVMLRDLAK